MNGLFFFPTKYVIILPVISQKRKRFIVSLSVVFILLSSCSFGQKSGNSKIPTETVNPTPTEAPLAARVNSEGILLAEYEAELKRYQAGIEQLGEQYVLELAKQEVLDYLITQTLYAQGAAAQGYFLEEVDLKAEIDELAEFSGGQDDLQAWIAENYYDQDSFRNAVSRDMAVIWMRNYLIAQVPITAEQIHARQILVDGENEAIGIQRQLEVGAPFKDLAFSYDPLTGGELGWFPRGYLLQPDVENAAYSLQPGQYSGIIPTSFGFHIVEVIEVDPQHPLSQDALLFMQHQALEKWLDKQRSASAIEILVN
jgi:peptidyl-prolyl cis-trans isomerase C